jgi:hypothetical protein
MEELANKLLDRINGLAKKGLKEDAELTPEQRRFALIRISENVRLIKRIEKVPVTGGDDDDDMIEEEVTQTHAPARGRPRRNSSAPAANG